MTFQRDMYDARLVHFVEDALVPFASGTALCGVSFPHPAQPMGMDNAEFLIVMRLILDAVNTRE